MLVVKANTAAFIAQRVDGCVWPTVLAVNQLARLPSETAYTMAIPVGHKIPQLVFLLQMPVPVVQAVVRPARGPEAEEPEVRPVWAVLLMPAVQVAMLLIGVLAAVAAAVVFIFSRLIPVVLAALPTKESLLSTIRHIRRLSCRVARRIPAAQSAARALQSAEAISPA